MSKKAEIEAEILKGLKNLSQLEADYKEYYYISHLVDLIAIKAYGLPHKHDWHSEVIYPQGKEYDVLISKIAMIINNMARKGIIKISKSNKMFKIN